MFVIKYSHKNNKTKYFNGKKLVSTLKAAMAFGESFREQFQNECNDCMSLKTIKVSEIAEMMYRDKHIKVSSISW